MTSRPGGDADDLVLGHFAGRHQASLADRALDEAITAIAFGAQLEAARGSVANVLRQREIDLTLDHLRQLERIDRLGRENCQAEPRIFGAHVVIVVDREFDVEDVQQVLRLLGLVRDLVSILRLAEIEAVVIDVIRLEQRDDSLALALELRRDDQDLALVLVDEADDVLDRLVVLVEQRHADVDDDRRRPVKVPLATRLHALGDADGDHLIDRGLLRLVTTDDLAVILDRRPAGAIRTGVRDEVRHPPIA